MTYASEADLLNVALFGTTAKEWRERNSQKKGNIRDYATLNQFIGKYRKLQCSIDRAKIQSVRTIRETERTGG